MGNRIGHSFPAAMLCAEAVFLPLDDGDDAALIVWIKRLVVGSPKLRRRWWWTRPLACIWILVQIALPLRMPLISGGEEASWFLVVFFGFYVPPFLVLCGGRGLRVTPGTHCY